MMKFKLFSALSLALTSTTVFAYGLGQSTFPLEDHATIISTEGVGILSNDGGAGLQFRATHRLPGKLSIDAGGGVNGGSRPNRVFAGADYEFLPDFMNQPRFSGKLILENAKEEGVRHNIVSFAPIVSKGLNFSGIDAYPYVSIPVGLNLNSNNNSYTTQISGNIGINAPIPYEDNKQLRASAEFQIGLKSSFTGVFAGLSYQL